MSEVLDGKDPLNRCPWAIYNLCISSLENNVRALIKEFIGK